MLLLAQLAVLQSQAADSMYDWVTTSSYFGTSFSGTIDLDSSANPNGSPSDIVGVDFTFYDGISTTYYTTALSDFEGTFGSGAVDWNSTSITNMSTIWQDDTGNIDLFVTDGVISAGQVPVDFGYWQAEPSAAAPDSSSTWLLLLPVIAVVGAARKFQRPLRKQPIAIPRPRQPWQGR